jgi:hypothetical protein
MDSAQLGRTQGVARGLPPPAGITVKLLKLDALTERPDNLHFTTQRASLLLKNGALENRENHRISD